MRPSPAGRGPRTVPKPGSSRLRRRPVRRVPDRSPHGRHATMAGGTSLRGRVVGAALRRYREMIGYQLEDAARVLDCDRSKISRIEAGVRGIRMLELRILLGEYGADADE